MEAIRAIEAIELIENRPPRKRKVYKQRSDPFLLREDDFRQRYRFSKETAAFIINLVRCDLEKDRRGAGTSPELQVLTAIGCWGRPDVSLSKIHEMFRLYAIFSRYLWIERIQRK